MVKETENKEVLQAHEETSAGHWGCLGGNGNNH